MPFGPRVLSSVAALGVLVAGIGGGVAIAQVPVLLAPAGLGSADAQPAPIPTYATNARGLTYGSAADAISPDAEPDLIRAEATNGRLGYVRKTELDAVDGTAAMAGFSSPEDALAWQADNAGREFTVAVYLEDGTTVIGEFVVTAGAPQG